MQRFQTPIDMRGNPILNLRAENVDPLPAAGSAGRLVYLTTNNRYYVDTGTGWAAVVTGSVQTSPTDTTAGRLLAVGAFGLGGLTPSFVGDLDRTDNTIAPGWYVINATSFTGTLPGTVGFYFLNHRRRAPGGGEVQIAIKESGGVCYVRTRTIGAWSAWAEQLDGSRLQSSATDNGPTKFLGVGAFGVGSTISTPEVLDLDNYTTPQGFYKVNRTTVLGTKPATGTVTDSLIVLRPNGNQIHQIYSVTNNGTTYIRKSIGTISWGPWNELYTSGNILGTVSQSGGVPTGAVIERGSNANGEYTKWADGTMHVTKRLTGLGPINLASGSLFISPSAVSIGTLAATFAAPPQRLMSPRFQTLFWPVSTAVAPTVSDGGNCTLVRGVTSAATDLEVDFLFVGRWF